MVIYVVIDEPQGVEKQTSGIATAFAGEILNEILPVLSIFPDGDIDYLIPSITPLPTPDGTTTEGTTSEENSNNAPAENSAADSQNTGTASGTAKDTASTDTASTNANASGEEGASMADQHDFGDE
jgi:stage V sporulation protein D (sporulation-specific penicillin-binding protein)